jgi:hypothetical protein
MGVGLPWWLNDNRAFILMKQHPHESAEKSHSLHRHRWPCTFSRSMGALDRRHAPKPVVATDGGQRVPVAPKPGGLSQHIPLHWDAAVVVCVGWANGDLFVRRQLAHFWARRVFLLGRHFARGGRIRCHGAWPLELSGGPRPTGDLVRARLRLAQTKKEPASAGSLYFGAFVDQRPKPRPPPPLPPRLPPP